MAAADALHDIPPAQRRRDTGKPHDPTRPAPTDRAEHSTVELDGVQSGRRRLAGRARERARPRLRGIGTLDEQMAQLRKVLRLDLRRRLHAHGLARARRGLGGSNLLRALSRRDPHRPRPGRARHLLHARGAGADDDRLRARRAGGGHGAASAARRGDLVPGLLRARHREQPGLPRLPGDAHRRRLAGQRAEGVDQPGAVRATVRAAHPHRDARVRAHGDHRALRRHGQRRHHGAARFWRCTEARSSARSSSTTSLVPADRVAGRDRPRLVDRHGPAALRAQHGAVAPGRLPPDGAWSSSSRRLPPGALDPPRSARRRSCCGRSGPGPGRPSAGSPPARRWGRRPRSTRSWWRRPSRRCSTSSARAWASTSRWGTTRPADAGVPNSSYSRAATIYGGSAEIQRNIIARRLLDLGADR